MGRQPGSYHIGPAGRTNSAWRPADAAVAAEAHARPRHCRRMSHRKPLWTLFLSRQAPDRNRGIGILPEPPSAQDSSGCPCARPLSPAPLPSATAAVSQRRRATQGPSALSPRLRPGRPARRMASAARRGRPGCACRRAPCRASAGRLVAAYTPTPPLWPPARRPVPVIDPALQVAAPPHAPGAENSRGSREVLACGELPGTLPGDAGHLAEPRAPRRAPARVGGQARRKVRGRLRPRPRRRQPDPARPARPGRTPQRAPASPRPGEDRRRHGGRRRARQSGRADERAGRQHRGGPGGVHLRTPSSGSGSASPRWRPSATGSRRTTPPAAAASRTPSRSTRARGRSWSRSSASRPTRLGRAAPSPTTRSAT
jgi:hypothetical protein